RRRRALKWRRGLRACVTLQVFYVRERFRHVSGLKRQQVADRLLAEAFLEHFDVTTERHWRGVADVVDQVRRTAGSRIGVIARPLRIGGRYPIAGPHDTFGDVVDK